MYSLAERDKRPDHIVRSEPRQWRGREIGLAGQSGRGRPQTKTLRGAL